MEMLSFYAVDGATMRLLNCKTLGSAKAMTTKLCLTRLIQYENFYRKGSFINSVRKTFDKSALGEWECLDDSRPAGNYWKVMYYLDKLMGTDI